jgi:nuclear pore complex protein Nup188
VRALRLYLLERRYLLKCAGIFLQAALDQQKNVNGISEKGKGGNEETPWIRRVGQDLLATLEKAERGMRECLLDSIRSLKAKFSSLENGSGWFKEEGGREDLEIEWLSNNIVEAVHTMEIIFQIVDNQGLIPSSEVVLEWFRFVSMFGFFDQFETVSQFERLACRCS